MAAFIILSIVLCVPVLIAWCKDMNRKEKELNTFFNRK
jgi:hypothetical protein